MQSLPFNLSTVNTKLNADFDALFSPVLAWEGKITLSEGPGIKVWPMTRWVGQRLG